MGCNHQLVMEWVLLDYRISLTIFCWYCFEITLLYNNESCWGCWIFLPERVLRETLGPRTPLQEGLHLPFGRHKISIQIIFPSEGWSTLDQNRSYPLLLKFQECILGYVLRVGSRHLKMYQWSIRNSETMPPPVAFDRAAWTLLASRSP